MSDTERIGSRDPGDGSAPCCSLCGAPAQDSVDGRPPLGWSADLVETGAGVRPRWVCDVCTRRFVRSIEAKLDHQWW